MQWIGVRVIGRPSLHGSLFRALGFAATASVPGLAVAVAVARRLSVPSEWAAYFGLIAFLLWLAISLTLAIKESFACRTSEAIRTLVGTVSLAMFILTFASLIVPYYVLRFFYYRYKRPSGPAPKKAVPSRLISQQMATRRKRYRKENRTAWRTRPRRWA